MRIIPIEYKSKRPNRRYLPNGEWRQYQIEEPCRCDVERWLADPFCNYAVICGIDNLVIVDFDSLSHYDMWLGVYGVSGYADTYTVTTGRGLHLYYYIKNLPKQTLKWKGGEVKSTGYCLIPPSIHPTGRKYTAVNPDLEIMTIGSIYEILPKSVFQDYEQKQKSAYDPIWNPAPNYKVDVNQSWRILDWFDSARRSGDHWYMVQCPFHNDGDHLSGWVNDAKNRFGCHGCMNGSLSAIDFYMKANNLVEVNEAIEQMGKDGE
jgi:hypothetical protein